MEVVIDDLFIILGPNLNIMSHDESYIDEDGDTLEDSYDEANMYNIFEHQLKLRKKNAGKISNLISVEPSFYHLCNRR